MILNKEAIEILAIIVGNRMYGLVPLDDEQKQKCREIANEVIDTFLLPEETELEESYMQTMICERRRVLALLMARP